MSGKGSGKKHNRASQSDQHGFQKIPSEIAREHSGSKKGGTRLERAAEKTEGDSTQGRENSS